MIINPYLFGVAPPPPSDGPLLHFDGANGSTSIVDAHGGSAWSVSGSAQLSTADAMFGPSSLAVNGGYVFTTNMGGPLGTEFCVQGFAKNTGSPRGLFHTFPNSSAGGLALGWGGSQWECYHNGSNTGCGGSILVGWFHWAVYRLAGTIYIAIAGTIIASFADSGDFGLTTSMYVGCYYNSGFPWAGFIDEVFPDLTHPIYGSSNFTPPTAPFT